MTNPATPPVFLVLGRTGQIGYELSRRLGTLGVVVAPTRKEVDLLACDSVRDILDRVKPSAVINAAAFTSVERAEVVPQLCARLNTDAPAFIAAECKRMGSVFVHFSTDYVFDGCKGTPYVETDEARPLCVYGMTKLAGEQAVVSEGGKHLVFRTSWVYATRGRNFPATVVQLAQERDDLAVVNDQTGAPTSAAAVADGVCGVLARIFEGSAALDASESAWGIYHMTADGSTTWFDFAKTILSEDPRMAVVARRCRGVRAITSAEHHSKVRRPAYSVLCNDKLAKQFGVRLPTWEAQWRATVDALGVMPSPEPDAATASPLPDPWIA